MCLLVEEPYRLILKQKMKSSYDFINENKNVFICWAEAMLNTFRC